MQFEKVIIFVKQTHHHNIFITNMIITLQSNPLAAKVIPSCLLALGIVTRSTKTTRFVSKWCAGYRSALAVFFNSPKSAFAKGTTGPRVESYGYNLKSYELGHIVETQF